MKTKLRRTQESSVCNRGSQNVNAEKKAAISVDSIVSRQTPGQEKPTLRYTTSSYQKILDYHVSEILLTTIILGVVLLLRLHH